MKDLQVAEHEAHDVGGDPARSTHRVNNHNTDRRTAMAESVYKVIELVGTSTESWEKAAAAAVNRAAKTLRDLRVAEVGQLDLQLENGKVKAYRAKVKVSFKYEPNK
jgi:dodecin